MDEQKKYIDAEEAISEIKQWYWNSNIQSIKDDPCVVDAMIYMFIRTIREQKAADVQPVKRGRWINFTSEGYTLYADCSICGGNYEPEPYCGKCGAIMENGEPQN